MRSKPPVFLGLGSNLGDRLATIEEALAALDRGGFRSVRRSRYYETEPVGGPEQGSYLNAVVRGETALAPAALLEACLEVERRFGRRRRVRWAPRTLDVDLLLYGDEVVDEPGLEIPHPRLHERRFVLVPLAEVGAEVRHPTLGLTVEELLERCPDRSRVEPFVRSETRA